MREDPKDVELEDQAATLSNLGGLSDAAGLRPHDQYARLEGGTISALKALVVWAERGKFVDRKESSAFFGKQEEAVRKQINNLTKWLGITHELMTRGGRRYELTELGKQFAGSAKRILAAFDEAVQELEGSIELAPLSDLPTIDVGCFNAAVKHFLAWSFGEARKSPNFPFRIRLNRDMNLRTVSPALLIESIGTRFHYVVVPWATEAVPRHLEHLDHLKLYEWRLVVIVPDDHPLRNRSTVTPKAVYDSCRDRNQPLPLLVSPNYNVSRTMLDDAFSRAGCSPDLTGMVENPDTYTRYALARNGQGIAIANSDAIPLEDESPYPLLVTMDQRHLRGLYTISWKGLNGPPAGIPSEVHAAFVQFISDGVTRFALDRPNVKSLI